MAVKGRCLISKKLVVILFSESATNNFLQTPNYQNVAMNLLFYKSANPPF